MERSALNTEKLNAFRKQLERTFGHEIAGRVAEALREPPTVSLRINPRKSTGQFAGLPRVPWAKEAYLLAGRPVFALDPLFHAGCYYVQDSSSMILEAVLQRLEFERENIAMLDACAAPGGKSLIMLDTLGHRGFLVSNEVDPKRNSILGENLLKWGNAGYAVCRAESSVFANYPEVFDLILTDAPCSGEGMFRKDTFALEQWTEGLVEQCVHTQKHILGNVRHALKPGGYLVYATCTLNARENQMQIETLLGDGFELALPSLDEFAPYLVPAEHKGKTLGHYLLPGISTGEGLFISVVRKTGHDQNPAHRKNNRQGVLLPFDRNLIRPFTDTVTYDYSWSRGNEVSGVNDPHGLYRSLGGLPFKSMGLPAYENKGKTCIPLHGLAMDPRLKGGQYDLDLGQALNFLRKQSTPSPQNAHHGWLAASYKGHPLGWVKAVPGRVNNYYPAHFRLRI